VVLQVTVPWTRPGSGFTLLFEAYIVIPAQAMPVKRIAELIGEHDTGLWRVLKYYVGVARLTFDKFHVLELLNTAVGSVRRQEQHERPKLKHTRYLCLKNPERLSAHQRSSLETLCPRSLNLKTVKAYRIRLAFQELWEQPPALAEPFLKKWYFWAPHSRVKPIKQCAKTIKKHWQGILNWFQSLVNNSIREGINSMIEAVKAKAWGYRTVEYFITMIYLISGKLNFSLPT